MPLLFEVLKMDIFHILLIGGGLTYWCLNNIVVLKRHYLPFVGSFTKKYIRALKKNRRYIRNWITYNMPFIPLNRLSKKLDMFETIDKEQLNKQQKLSSWNYDVGILNLNSSHNVGIIYRTGCLTGMNKYILFGSSQYKKNSSVGLTYVDVEQVDIFPKLEDKYDESTISIFDKKLLKTYITNGNYIPVIFEQGGSSIISEDFSKWERNIPKGFKYIFIFGNETHGIPQNMVTFLKEEFPKTKVLSIPQWGCAHSYNVGQAANIVMYRYCEDNMKHMIKNI